MITSAKQSHWFSDVIILDLEDTGLPSPSVVRQKVFTLEEGLIVKAIGQLTTRDWQVVKQQLAQQLAL